MTTPADLPSPGAGRETGTLDFKGDQDPADQRELAKDIAGFANALGGALLVGAYEDTTKGVLGTYRPLDSSKAEVLKRAYELAATQRCQPNPVIDVVRIAVPPDLSAASGDVVAVNVYPVPMGPVGVRWDSDKGGPSFAFPLRTATHTHFLQPTELTMLMVPEIRRVAILLDSIPSAERRNVTLHVFGGGVGQTYPGSTLVSVDPQATSVHLQIPGATGTIPLDRVESVWKGGDHVWSVAVRGKIETRSSSLLFFPA